MEMKKKRKSALKQVMRYYGASIEVMAEETGIPRNTIENYTSEVRTSIRNAKAINAQKIADYLRIDLHYLLEVEGWPLENYFTGEVLKMQNMLKPKRKKRKRKSPEYNENVEKEFEICNTLSDAKPEELLKKLSDENSYEWIRRWIIYSEQFQKKRAGLSDEQINEVAWRFKNLLECYEDSRPKAPDIHVYKGDEKLFDMEIMPNRQFHFTGGIQGYLKFMNSFSGEGDGEKEKIENEEGSISDKEQDADKENE